MNAVIAPVQLLCRQCSAPLSVEQGTKYVSCEYCGTTNIVDKSQSVLHYAVRPTLRQNDAEAALRRWMAGNKTIKGLDREAKIEREEFLHFPMWLVRTRKGESDEVFLEPAAATSISELKKLTIPAADLEPYDQTMDEDAVEATVPYKAMLGWLKETHGVEQIDIQEVSLVHLPAYQFKYRYKERSYTALVDAASGSVFANLFPSKWEAPYRTIGGVAFVAYFMVALIPLVAFLIGGAAGMGIGMIIYFGVALALAIPIFIFAAAVSAKV
jgi:LSD1 subclass zinc finger protein